MSTNKAQNYQLHGWAPEDEFPRGELNANFTKLDTALKAEETARAAAVTAEANTRAAAVNTLNTALAGKVVAGTYTGNGAASQTISLGFTPKIVFVAGTNGRMNESPRTHAGLAYTGHPAANAGNAPIVTIVTGGFQVYMSNNEDLSLPAPQTNLNGRAYNYMAVR